MSARILLAEDDPKQSHLIRIYLEREGHSVLVSTTAGGPWNTAGPASPTCSSSM